MKHLKLLILTVVVTVIGSGLLFAAGDTKKELEKFQGKWVFAASTFDGNAAKKEEIKDRAMVFKGDKVTLVLQGKEVGTASVKMDPDKKPAEMDLTFEDGPMKGMVDKRIYKLEGGKLTFCYRGMGKERPKEFSSKAGSGIFLEALEKSK